jgi:hypothetical protein
MSNDGPEVRVRVREQGEHEHGRTAVEDEQSARKIGLAQEPPP